MKLLFQITLFSVLVIISFIFYNKYLKETKIIEIIPSNHPNRKCERVSKILKLKYFRIVTRPDNSNKNFPFRIHLEKPLFVL